MALNQFAFDIVQQTKEFQQLGNLFYFERLIAEVNTRGVAVTPTLTLETTDISLSTITTSTRDLVEVTVDRLGPFSALTFSPVTDMQWYSVGAIIRPLVLGLRLVGRALRTTYPGRSASVATTIRWDINPFALPADARNQQIIAKRVYLDLVTGSESVTPVIEYADGTSDSLSAVTQATRAVVEFAVLTGKRLKAFRLDGDFSNSDIVIHDVEMDAYMPNARTLATG